MQVTQLTDVLHITVNRNSVRANIIECRQSSPNETTIDFASNSLIPTGSYPAEWHHGDQSSMGVLMVGFVLFLYVKQGIYLYGGSFRRHDSGEVDRQPPA